MLPEKDILLINQTIPDIVTNQLRQAIINGDLKPGQKLIQDEIAAQYNISRMPVREALRRLEAEGYVVNYPHRGVTVTELTPDEIEEIFLIRILLEGLASRLAAKKMSDDVLNQLQDMLHEMEVNQDKPDRYHSLNAAFHDLVFRTASRNRLHDMAMNLRNVVESHLQIYLQAEGRIQRAQEGHRALLKALSSRDPDKAEEVARYHLQQALNALLNRET